MATTSEPRRRFECVPVPAEMQHLPRDRRGFPIPEIVFRDQAGQPHFTINDTPKSIQALAEERCPICWGKLTRGRWFVGGPLSALHENGAFADPPGHRACVTYALQVCPYLAAPSYAKRIDGETLIDRAGIAVALDPTVVAARPEIFVAVMAVGQSVRWGMNPTIRPKRPYRAVEYWRHGVRLADAEGERISAAILSAALPSSTQPRVLASSRLRVAAEKH